MGEKCLHFSSVDKDTKTAILNISRGAWPAQSEEQATLGLGGLDLGARVEITKKK